MLFILLAYDMLSFFRPESLLCVYLSYVLYSSVDGHLGWSRKVGVVSSGSGQVGLTIVHQFWFLLGGCSVVRHLDLCGIYFFGVDLLEILL